MKKYLKIFISIIVIVIFYFLFYDYSKVNTPNEYYNVYLDGKLLGTILSKEELEKHIDEVTSHYINATTKKEKYYIKDNDEELNYKISQAKEVEYGEDKKGKYVNLTFEEGDYVETINTPSGLKVEKVLTFKGNINSVEEIYEKIQDLKPFTVKGYQFTIKKDKESKYVYVMDPEIFEKAVNSLIETYVGVEEYKNYLNDTQKEIETTGTIIENVYIDEEITVKEKQIPVNATIYENELDLAQFLLFGKKTKTNTYSVLENEMIDDIALKNKISVKEFLISNPDFRNENTLIKPGTKVNIKETNPQLSVVTEQFVVEDKVNEYKTKYKYDDNEYVGYYEVIQEGEDGLERVSQREKIVNGLSVYVEPKGKEILKQSVDKIVVKGDKYVPNVGDLSYWAWPSESGYTNTDGWGWRIHPITGERSFHYGLDIAGTGYNSDIYAANNGTIITMVYRYDFGNYIVIDHNNGYYTLYGHMTRFAPGLSVGSTVERGQLIGYVGSTGWSTGPHIHFEVWHGCKFCRISPWSIY